MRLKYLLLFGFAIPGLILFTACTKQEVAELEPAKESPPIVVDPAPETKAPEPPPLAEPEKPESSEAAKKAEPKPPVKTEPKPPAKTAAELAAEKKLAAEKAAKKLDAEANDALKSVNKEFTDATTDWRNRMRAASAEERASLMDDIPQNHFGDKYLKLADKYTGTKVAVSALTSALTKGAGEAKTKASNRLLELAEMDSGTDESKSILLSLARSGADEAKNTASTLLVDSASKSLDNGGEEILSNILKIRGDSEGKTKAAEMMLKLAEADVRSNKAFDQLSTIANSVTGQAKAKAFNLIAEHHLDNDKLVDMLKGIGRTQPAAETEDWLKTICKKATSDKIKGNAAVALSGFVSRRDMYRDFYADAEEDVLKNVDADLLTYLNRTPDPSESELIESVLDGYVKGNEKLIEEVKKQLFVVQNLSIGKSAPDIEAVDLDGVNFKLSDYRGKIVFLDFWGDW